MKNKRNYYIAIILVLLLMSVVPVSSQTLKTADLYFTGGAYYSAANMYRSLLNLKKKNTEVKDRRGEILFRIGECYRKMNKTDDAKKWYLQAQALGYSESDLYYGLGCMQMMEKNYTAAKSSFQQAKDKNQTDKRIELKIASCDLYHIYEKANGQYEIKPVDNLNTRGSEYGLSFYGDKLIYASTGVSSSRKEISERTGLPYSDLYIASPDSKSLYGRVEKLETTSGGKSNEGTFCYDMQTNQLYCTRCEENNRNCYIVKIDEKNGKYKEGGKLKLGNQTYGIGHPYITDDGRRIYFTSIMDGGYGEADLWYVDRAANGEYGMPVNLGENINTAGNEVFPAFIDGVLYFSSDGHPGLGGLDLFASYMEDDGSFSKPFNMRAPFNSSWDDFNLVHRPSSNIGFFVSNRNNSASSDDIYTFNNFPPRMIIFNGQVYDNESKEPLQDYTIVVNEGDTKIYEQKVTGSEGYFLYMRPDKNYDIKVSSPEYLSKTQLVSTAGVKNFAELSADTYLSKDEVEVAVVNLDKDKMVIEMKNITYEFDKFQLTELAKIELDKYLVYFIQYPDMIVEINSHTDSRGSNSYNNKLSEQRAKAVVEYFILRGVNPSRLVWRGYGEEQLLIPNARTEAEHQANRRTVFKILTLGINNNTENTKPRNTAALETNTVGGVVDMSGWWIRIHKSNDNNQIELPIIKQVKRITGKEIHVIKYKDGLYHYCIKYAAEKEALKGQILLYKENIKTEIFQF
jgi:outer membrane protein OmpA-like peptidoglycan-associated protein